MLSCPLYRLCRGTGLDPVGDRMQMDLWFDPAGFSLCSGTLMAKSYWNAHSGSLTFWGCCKHQQTLRSSCAEGRSEERGSGMEQKRRGQNDRDKEGSELCPRRRGFSSSCCHHQIFTHFLSLICLHQSLLQ